MTNIYLRIVFQPGNWIWVHIRNKRSLTHQKSKLQPQKDRSFQILERINNNAYKMSMVLILLSMFFYLTLFNVGDDLRLNPFKEREKGWYILTYQQKDPLEVPIETMTRLMAKKLKETLNVFVQYIWVNADFKKATKPIRHPIINLIQVQ